jgi:hypothetical protein
VERTLQDLVAEGYELHKKLVEMGVPEDHVLDIINALGDYQELQNDLKEARNTQFWDDAFTLTQETKANNKLPSIAIFLRTFAEHIATQTLMQVKVQIDHVSGLVDNIPAMTLPDEERHN